MPISAVEINSGFDDRIFGDVFLNKPGNHLAFALEFLYKIKVGIFPFRRKHHPENKPDAIGILPAVAEFRRHIKDQPIPQTIPDTWKASEDFFVSG